MTEFELAQALFRQQQAADASSMPTTSQVRGVAASDSADGVVTVVLDATAGGASAEMEVPTTGGITEGGEVLVTLLDGVPVEVTQAGSIDDAVGTATKYITETINDGIRVHPGGDIANYTEIDADGIGVVKGGTSVAHFGEDARVGAEDGGHVTVTDGGLGVYEGATMLSEFAGGHASILPHWADAGRQAGDIGYISVVGDSGRIETEIGGTRDIMRIKAFGPLYLQAYDGVYAQSDNGGLRTSMDLSALPGIQHGSVGQTTNVPAMGYHDFDVTFPLAFSTTPDVLLTICTTTSATTSFDCDIYLCAVTTTGFTARIVNRENATSSPGFTWLAIG